MKRNSVEINFYPLKDPINLSQKTMNYTDVWTRVYPKDPQNNRIHPDNVDSESYNERRRWQSNQYKFPSPCKPALYEKKQVVMQGPYIACPIKIFFKVVSRSRLGKISDTKLNHKCCDGPKISNPYAAIRNVLIESNEPEAGDVISYKKNVIILVSRGTSKKSITRRRNHRV